MAFGTEIANLRDEDVHEEGFCERYGLPVRKGEVRIYDAFMFNGELDMLEVRLEELYDVVDYFVIGAALPYWCRRPLHHHACALPPMLQRGQAAR